MKKIYVFICLLICMVPSVCMSFAKTDSTAENRRLAKFPSIKAEDGININFLDELGKYFEDHYAFKNEMVLIDTAIMREGFGESPVSTVVLGKNDWFYLKSTIDDYLGQNVISDREAYSLVNNLEIVKDYVENHSAKFVFTVAPNKNSLYDENMPAMYSVKACDISNIDKIETEIKNTDISYADLFAAFSNESEILYRAQDSHWNEKGAVLASNTILDKAEKEHEDYADIPLIKTHTEIGDLAKLYYSYTAKPEWDYLYDFESNVSFTNSAENWESMSIETANPDKNGSVLMFRDSFGNTLSKYIAEEYGKGFFSRATIYRLAGLMDQYNPDTVIFEIVERNVSDLAEYNPDDSTVARPPVIEAPEYTASVESTDAEENKAEIKVNQCMSDFTYYEIFGEADEEYLSDNTNFILNINGANYRAYSVSVVKDNKKSDNGFVMYIQKSKLDSMADSGINVDVYAETNGKFVKLASINNIEIEETEVIRK